MPIIASKKFNDVKVYWCSLGTLDKYGKYTITIGGLTDEQKEFIKRSSKQLKADSRTGDERVRFSIKPEKIKNFVFVDSRNHKIDKQTHIPNGSKANISVSLFQNAMGTYLLLNGVQIVEYADSTNAEDLFEDLAGPDGDDSNPPWGTGVDVDG